MRTIIINGIVISLMMFAMINGEEKGQHVVQPETTTLSKITNTCLSHIASIIAQQKKQFSAHAAEFEGTYHSPKTSLGSIEYEIHEKKNGQLLILAQIEFLRFALLPDTFSTYFAKLSDDQGDKLRAALDDSFGRTLWQWIKNPLDFEKKPDTVCRCRFFARGSAKTTEQTFYQLNINIPTETLASYVQAAKHHHHAEQSLSHAQSSLTSL